MQNEMYGNGGQQPNVESMGFGGGGEPVRQADQQQTESLFDDPMDYRPRQNQR